MTDLEPVSFTWTSAGIWAAVLALIAAIIRQLGPWRKQLSDLETRMREELRNQHERCEAELRIVRHRTHNQRTIIYALLHLFDQPVARRKEMLTNIRADLASMEQAEATESGIVSSGGTA